ncbi:GATOR complex protein WDR24 [Aphelenchoides fujianensis]|nr:GATOR complex protein WDR24 [Aphelenchoides fujianensis]
MSTSREKEEYVIKSVVQDVGEAMDALATNRNFDRVAVAGKAVMKLYSIKNTSFELELDLRTKTRGRSVYFSGSISWNPISENLIAATSSTGSIVVFDLDHCRRGNSQESIRFIDPVGGGDLFRANVAAATKVCFHSFNPYLFVSGSKDATIWLHDYRQHRPVASFGVNGGSVDSIRDLQFCLDKDHETIFVTGDDSGTVRFWDIRHANECLKEFIGNAGTLSSIALNPRDWKLLATGGRDRFVRIWDWSVSTPVAIETIETPTTIGRVEWDSSSRFEFATATNLHDHQLLMWDYRRPALPFKTFRGHEANISDISFPQQPRADERKFVTCGKDRRLILHFTEFGDSTVETSCPSISMAMGPHNELITAVPEPYVRGDLLAEYNFEQPLESKLLHFAAGDLPKFNDPDALVRFAKAYRFQGDHPLRICNWNSHVTKQLGNFHLAYTWSVIGVLIQQAGLYIPPPPRPPFDRYFDYVDDPENPPPARNLVDDDDEESEEEEEDAEQLEAGVFNQNFQESLSLETGLFFGSEEFGNAEAMPGGARFLDFLKYKHEDSMKAGVQMNEDAVCFNQKETDEDDDSNSNSLREEVAESTFEDEEDDSTSNGGTISPPLVADEFLTLESDSVCSGPSEAELRARHLSEHLNLLPATGEVENWGPLSALKRLINAYSDVGNSQLCATVCLMIGKTISCKLFGEEQVASWFFHYIELLQDAGNNELATFMAKECELEEVVKSIQENMHVRFFCSKCNTSTPSGKTSCEKCGTAFATVCTVCDYPTNGLYSQCNECGHGGHAGHLEEWFRSFGICAFPGCEHVCVPADSFSSASSECSTPDTPKVDENGHEIPAFKAIQSSSLAQGVETYVDEDETVFYRDEKAQIKPIPPVFSFSTAQPKRRHKYSLDP